MAIIIGAATEISFAGACAISANWGYNPNAQRLYCIGEWTPRDELTFYRPTQTLSITIYAPGPSYSVTPTQSCSDANTIAASVSPAACGGSVGGDVSGSWHVTSYSYSKEDAAMPGQESWSLTKWKDVPSPSSGNSIEPTYVMRGISEGQSTGNAGVTFNGDTVETTTGNVSAGGFGRADTLEVGVVASVGGGSSSAGDTGQGSASMPYTPLYI
jgi:hypothetical protein